MASSPCTPVLARGSGGLSGSRLIKAFSTRQRTHFTPNRTRPKTGEHANKKALANGLDGMLDDCRYRSRFGASSVTAMIGRPMAWLLIGLTAFVAAALNSIAGGGTFLS